MTPLTVDCARARQLLPDLQDGADSLPADERAFVEGHLAGCPGCQQAQKSITAALRALEHLSPTDVARLRSLADGELDPRPLAKLVVACLVGVLLLTLGVVVSTRRHRSPGDAPAVKVRATPTPPPLSVPAVGAEMGLEEEADLVAAPIDLPAGERVPERPAPAADAPGGAAPEQVVAALPAPVSAPDAAPDGGAPAPATDVERVIPPAPPPVELLAQFARLQLSKGVRYRDVTLYFARDAQARDRLGRGRAAPLLAARETSPPEPNRSVLRPPGGQSSYRLLGGELLDAPCGLRIAATAAKVTGRVELPVAPAGFDALAAIEGRARREPVLRSPVLVPSRARAALIEGVEPGPVAVLLEKLADPTLLEFERLRRELARIEPEARELERRLRPKLEDERGLRGVAISVGGTPRSLDVFSSSRDLSDALPKLLRAALLEAALEAPAPGEGDMALGADPRSAAIETGVEEGRDAHQALLAALPGCRRDPESADGAPVFERWGGAEVAAIWMAGGELLHAAVLSRP